MLPEHLAGMISGIIVLTRFTIQRRKADATEALNLSVFLELCGNGFHK
jgi:hypothetical protein